MGSLRPVGQFASPEGAGAGGAGAAAAMIPMDGLPPYCNTWSGWGSQRRVVETEYCENLAHELRNRQRGCKEDTLHSVKQLPVCKTDVTTPMIPRFLPSPCTRTEGAPGRGGGGWAVCVRLGSLRRRRVLGLGLWWTPPFWMIFGWGAKVPRRTAFGGPHLSG